MSNALQSFARSIDRISGFFFGVCSILTIVLVLLTTEQVIARYFFNASSVALQELEWHLFGLIILLSMARALKSDDHVRVDILYSKTSKRTQILIDCAGLLLFLMPVCIVLILYGYSYATAALAFPNPFPLDHWSAAWFAKDSTLYSFSASIESFLRSHVILGEVSADPGGLEARWIIKAAIPFGFALLLLQGVAECTHKFLSLKQKEVN